MTRKLAGLPQSRNRHRTAFGLRHIFVGWYQSPVFMGAPPHTHAMPQPSVCGVGEMTGGGMCDTVKTYLDRRSTINHRRVKCCNSSRSLYCPECCALLVEPDNRPPPISLPYKLDIVLDEKNRAKSTGIHAKCLMNAQQRSEESTNSCALYDLERGDALPNFNEESGGGTYILFPVPGESVPLASVASDIDRLVVLDCKWTKSSC